LVMCVPKSAYEGVRWSWPGWPVWLGWPDSVLGSLGHGIPPVWLSGVGGGLPSSEAESSSPLGGWPWLLWVRFQCFTIVVFLQKLSRSRFGQCQARLAKGAARLTSSYTLYGCMCTAVYPYVSCDASPNLKTVLKSVRGEGRRAGGRHGVHLKTASRIPHGYRREAFRRCVSEYVQSTRFVE